MRQGRLVKTFYSSIAVLGSSLLFAGTASAYAHANYYGGSSYHGYDGSAHVNAFGGSTEHSAYGGTSHTNAYGGTTTGEVGYGAEHTNTYGQTSYASAYHPPSSYYGYGYHPPTAYYGYHPPTTVNYYGSGCYNCSSGSSNGWAAAAGLVVGAAVGASVASANTAAATSNAYAAGVATGSANTAAATTNAYVAGVAAGASAASYPMGTLLAAVPPGSIQTVVQGQTYYLNGNTWYQPAYGANGLYYRVVPTP
jgi:hypothetical protein